MELKLGIMSPQEIADWFGISKSYYGKKRTEKLKELEKYCKFKAIPYKGINVEEIYISQYVRSGRQLVEQKVEEEWTPDRIDIPSNIGKIIYRNNEDVQKLLTEHSVEMCVGSWKIDKYGVSKRAKRTVGEYGSSKYIFVKILTDKNGIKEYIRLTPEEQSTRFEIYRKYFRTRSEWYDQLNMEVEGEYRALKNQEGQDLEALELWHKEMQAAMVDKVNEYTHLNDEDRQQKYAQEIFDEFGETGYAIQLEPGIFFNNSKNVEHYSEKYEF